MSEQKLNNHFLNIALKKGDEQAFQTIYERHYKSLFSFINSYTNDPSLTSDIIQDTFVKLWEKKKNIDEKTSILAFLNTIAYHIFIDNYRKKKREKEHLDTYTYQSLVKITEDDQDVFNERVAKIKVAIEELPPKCQEVFRLSKFEGFKYAEIAQRMNISIKTVEAQMGKAFSSIRNKVKPK